jgi:preprotein translocase subunit SecG
MIELIGFIINILLIVIIFLRLPKKSLGLSNVTIKTNVFGSPSSAERALNILTIVGIFFYVSIALTLNLNVNLIH